MLVIDARVTKPELGPVLRLNWCVSYIVFRDEIDDIGLVVCRKVRPEKICHRVPIAWFD